MASAARGEDRTGRLVEAIRGDEAAFEDLLAPVLESAFRLAVVMLRDQEEARDVVQEACFAAWRKLPQLNAEDRFRTWFLSIVANRCRSVTRTRWWSMRRTPFDAMRAEFDHDAASGRLDLRRALQRLPESDRAALFLFFYLDLPLEDVGRILRVSQKAAKSRVHRAVTRLRALMKEVVA